MRKETRSDEERVEGIRQRLTPELDALIRERIAQGVLPAPIRAALSESRLEAVAADRASLESVGNVAALEAIVQRFGRPPLVIRGGEVGLEPLPDFPPDTAARIVGAQRWIPSVGRVEFVNHNMDWGGTGWIIDVRGSAHIVATNRHVAKIVAKRRADGRAVFMRRPSGTPYGMKVDFEEEVGSAGDDRTAVVTRIEYLADDLSADVALLRIEGAAFALGPPFELADTEAGVGERVALIGYPAHDSRNDEADQARYFRDLYEVKRFSPGFIMQALSGSTDLIHDCTSLGGNSGSPVLSLENGKVVGLHFAGMYGKFNSAVGVRTLKQLLTTGAVSVTERLAMVAGTEGRRDSSHDAAFFARREGFDQDFLGIRTAWPKLTAELEAALATPSDNPQEPNELRYRHFGVKYSGQHKLPLITGVNIDGKHAVRIKRKDDQWFSDGRIPAADQLGSANFVDAQIDRGHMVRREDPNWDPALDEVQAKIANDDTFHYVNACAQHSSLNQGKTLWQGLENYILDNSRTHAFKASVFTGPVLRPEDAEESEIEIDGALVPLEFWKLVVLKDEEANALRATAYLLSQGQLLQDLLRNRSRREALEGFEFGEYRTFQIAVRDLAAATGYDFHQYVAADPLVEIAGAAESIEDGEPLFVALEYMTSLVL
jgi:endonuclease G